MIKSTQMTSRSGDEALTMNILVDARAMQAEAGARFVRAVWGHMRDGFTRALHGGAAMPAAHPRA